MTILATYEAEEAKRRKRDGFLHCEICRDAIEATAKAHKLPVPEVKDVLREAWTPEVGG